MQLPLMRAKLRKHVGTKLSQRPVRKARMHKTIEPYRKELSVTQQFKNEFEHIKKIQKLEIKR